MICGPTGQPVVILESLISMNVGGGGTTERRIRTSQPDDESVRCRGSKVRGQPSDSSPFMQLPITPSTSSAISPPPERTEPSERRPRRRGARSPPLLEPDGLAGIAASAIPQRDNAVAGAGGRTRTASGERFGCGRWIGTGGQG